MPAKFKTLPAATFFLGIVCFSWILYDVLKIYSDLRSVIFFGSSGLIVGIGYLFIVLFHALMFIIYLRYFRRHQNPRLRIVPLSLLIVSFLALAVEKTMYDEVGREYFLELPVPGEVIFIYFGLFLNALFIAYALYCIARDLNFGLEKKALV